MSKKSAHTERSRSGFTLIELMVSLTIIAILATIGLVSYSSVLKQGRDSKRQSDLRSLQSALEQYYSDQGFYPSADLDTLLNTSPPPPFTSSIGNPSPPPNPKTYLNSPPQDPTGTLRYIYRGLPFGCIGTQCSSYCLYAKLENPPSPVPPPPSGCPYPSGYNLVVIPP